MQLIIKLLVYGIIMLLASFFIKKIKDDKTNSELYFEQKIVSYIYFLVSIGFSILFIIVGSFPSNVEGLTKLVMTVCAISINLLLYLVGYIYYIRFLKFEKDKITYRLGLTKKKLMYSDITLAKLDDYGNILLFVNKKLILKLPKEIYAGGLLREHNVPFAEINENNFTMNVTKFYKGIAIVCCIIFLFFLIFSILVNYFLGIILFALMLFISLIDSLNKEKKKIIVSFDDIKEISLFSTKVIKVSEIKKAEIKDVNNAEVLFIYSEKGLEMKISMLYSNSILLKKKLKSKIISE